MIRLFTEAKRTAVIFAMVFILIMTLSIAANAQGYTLSGTVSANRPSESATVSLMTGEETVYTAEFSSDRPHGQTDIPFTVTGISEGMYDMIITKPGHLKYTLTGLRISGDTDLSDAVSPELIVGDISGDGYIDGTDVSYLVYDLTKSEQDATYKLSDLNGDGYRDAIDTSIISFNLLKKPKTEAYPSLTLVSFVMGDGDDAKAADDIYAEFGDEIRLPGSRALKAGYIFSGWSDGEAAYKKGDIYTVSGDVTFMAIWTDANKMTVSSCDNSGEWMGHPGASLITENAAEGSGCIGTDASELAIFSLAGDWNVTPYLENGAMHISVYVDNAANVTGPTVLEITSSGAPDSRELSWSIPTRSIKTGWNDFTLRFTDAAEEGGAPDPSKMNYIRFYMYLSGSTSVRIDDLYLTLVPKEEKTYRVTYTRNLGSGNAPELIMANEYDLITVSDNTFKREGYTFEGWYEEKTGVYVQPGDKLTVTDNLTLVAQWRSEGPGEYQFAEMGNEGLTYHLPVSNKNSAQLTVSADQLLLSHDGKSISLTPYALFDDGLTADDLTPVITGVYGDPAAQSGLVLELSDIEFANDKVILSSLAPAQSLSAIRVATDATNQISEAMKIFDGGESYYTPETGVSVHAFNASTSSDIAYLTYDISSLDVTSFTATLAMDYGAALLGNFSGSSEFIFYCDENEVYRSGKVGVTEPVNVTIEIPKGTQTFKVEVTDAGDTNSGDWANIANGYFAKGSVGKTPKRTALAFIGWDSEHGVLSKKIAYKYNDLESSVTLREIILDTYPKTGENSLENDLITATTQAAALNYSSFPAYLTNFFVGIEFPTASTRQSDTEVTVAHQPHMSVKSDEWYETKTEVIGIAQGDTQDAFQSYLLSRALVGSYPSFHFNYNSWWSIGFPFTESIIDNLIDNVCGNLSKYGECFDSFALDMGWSNPESIWEIDFGGFPDGFTNIGNSAAQYDSRIGLWFSPSAAYPDALNQRWARQNGYSDVDSRYLCLYDEKYTSELVENIPYIIGEYGINMVKCDGLFLNCGGTNHNHTNSTTSIERSAENVIALYQAMVKANPSIWIETTCYGYNPSPWWLMYVSSMVGAFGDDAPHGRVPAPEYRISATTGREYYNLQGATVYYAPAASQEELGVIHQTADDFTDDMIDVLMRGNAFVPMYINPNYMSDARWERMANIMKWARANEGAILSKTAVILPEGWELDGNTYAAVQNAAMTRTPYGYSHSGLVMLRNPWIEKQSITINPPIDKGDSGAYDLISVYPEVRVYAQNVTADTDVTVTLSGYETIVLKTVAPGTVSGSVYTAPSTVSVSDNLRDITVDASSGVDLTYTATVTTTTGDNQLLVLIEATDALNSPQMAVKINGSTAPLTYVESATGWTATLLPTPENWKYAIAELPIGESEIEVTVSTSQLLSNLGIYVRTTKSTPNATSYTEAAPSPEKIAVDSTIIYSEDFTSSDTDPFAGLASVSLTQLTPKSYSSAVAFNTNGLNQNNDPIKLASGASYQTYDTGISLHAFVDDKTAAYVEYDISRYTFDSLSMIIGFDYGTVLLGNPYGSGVIKVLIDGEVVHDSGFMKSTDQPQSVDIAIPQRARTLRIEVYNGGENNEYEIWNSGDWATIATPTLYRKNQG